MSDALTVYCAGALFTTGELAGNVLLSSAVSKASGGAFRCVLPQDFELRAPGPRAIRDADYKLLLDCDCALFNFDGLELDSGTLAEFLFAKSLDMPCAILRTDFRHGGDQGSSGDPWNLMCSFHPRTETSLFDSLGVYKHLLSEGLGGLPLCEALAAATAAGAVEALRKAVATPPLDKTASGGAKAVLLWTVKSRGESLERLCEADPRYPDALLERKLSRRLM